MGSIWAKSLKRTRMKKKRVMIRFMSFDHLAMSLISNHRKKRNARQRKVIHDRLTNLPDSLKTKILSSLPTKDAVATSILSKEWRRSWTSVTSLDFDDNSEFNEDFINFVNRVLLLHDRSCLQLFRMKCSKKCRDPIINAWIAAVLLSNTIKEIDLSVEFEDERRYYRTYTNYFHLPNDTFLCKTLVVLKLHLRCCVSMPASVSLPCLKTLHISDVVFSDDVSTLNLFSGCPVLEELRLSRCVQFSDDVCVNIIVPSSSLTSLAIDNLPSDRPQNSNDFDYQVVIDTPSLRHLNFSDYSVGGYELKNLNHLIKAEIDVGLRYGEEFTDQFVELHSNRMTDLFIGISQVQSLVLSSVSVEMIYWCDVEFPTFSNLTFLELDIKVPYSTKWLLEENNILCLEPLYIRKGTPYTINEFGQREYERYRSIDDMSPPSFLSHLKEIKIDGLGGFKYEMPMVEYILKNAKVLEKLTLKYRSFRLGEAKQLLMLPRSSPICKVEIL